MKPNRALRPCTGRRAAALLAFAAAACPLGAAAVEGGVGNILPGNTATLVDLAPTQPGWVVQANYANYSSGAAVGSRIATLKLDQSTDAYMLSGFYTFETKVMGADFSVGANLPYASMDVTVALDTPLGTLKVKDHNTGFGDLTVVPAMLAWKKQEWQYTALLSVYAPTGEYDKSRLASPGLNYWTFDPTVGVSYNNEENGFNAAVFGGIGFNTRNKATDYHSGSLAHIDASVQQLLPLGSGYLGLGAEVFHIRQISGDTGSGAVLGSLKGRTSGYGPVVSYILPLGGKESFVAEARWLREKQVKNRLGGDLFWLKLLYQF